MPLNIEIKAKVPSAETLHNLIKRLPNLTGTPVVINQEDTFFQDEKEELIFYKRSDKHGPKLCQYVKVERPNGELSGDLFTLFSEAFGIKGKVIKRRVLYMAGQTRIHLDEVEGLGTFMELEVVLQDNQIEKDGQNIAENLMKSLAISKEDLISRAYIDLLIEKQHKQ